MEISLETGNQQFLDVFFTNIVDDAMSLLKKHLPTEKIDQNNAENQHVQFCNQLNYKYHIIIDGWVSSWKRAP